MDMSKYIGEATAYDKKLMLERKEPLSWLKSVSAFANTSGGLLLYGVDNDGNLVGLENAERDAEDISEMIKSLMDPIPEFDLSLHSEDGRKFVVVSVKAGRGPLNTHGRRLQEGFYGIIAVFSFMALCL